jgi:hypothetical protein
MDDQSGYLGNFVIPSWVTLASLKVTFHSLLGMKQSNTTPIVKHISVWREKLRLLSKYKITLDARVLQLIFLESLHNLYKPFSMQIINNTDDINTIAATDLEPLYQKAILFGSTFCNDEANNKDLSMSATDSSSDICPHGFNCRDCSYGRCKKNHQNTRSGKGRGKGHGRGKGKGKGKGKGRGKGKGKGKGHRSDNGWKCGSCDAYNFARNETCYKCDPGKSNKRRNESAHAATETKFKEASDQVKALSKTIQVQSDQQKNAKAVLESHGLGGVDVGFVAQEVEYHAK